MHSPRWLFLLPGFVLIGVGSLALGVIGVHSVNIGGLNLDVHTLSYAGAAIVLGVQMVIFAVLTKSMGIRHGWLPDSASSRGLLSMLTLERCLVSAALLFLAGIAMSFYAVYLWSMRDFGALDPSETMRWVIPSATLMAVGGEISLAAFFLEALRLPDARR